ncbi:MAG TPA: alanine-tRNA synthetase second additional domain-containing protein [Bacillota bacterium]|nr:alanine-tRNA synthetase second additional domain-containing protein [Bacillota bacterium]
MAQSEQISHIMSTYYAPRGRRRIYTLGVRIAQLYLSPFDKLIGVTGDPGCGKSSLIKGMFPGLELTNDDDGINIRPLPLLGVEYDETGFFSPHTYHVDIRFEMGFTQLTKLADAIMTAVRKGKRVVVEHFELIYPMIPINADMLIGIGEEIIVTRPDIFGPEPQEIYDVVHLSLPYRLMAHTAEDLCEQFLLGAEGAIRCTHGDLHHGFSMIFDKPPAVAPEEIEKHVREKISQDLPVAYFDESHIKIGDDVHVCTGPRTHVRSTGEIENFNLLGNYIHDHINDRYLLIGAVGEGSRENLLKLESIQKWDSMAGMSDFIF